MINALELTDDLFSMNLIECTVKGTLTYGDYEGPVTDSYAFDSDRRLVGMENDMAQA